MKKFLAQFVLLVIIIAVALIFFAPNKEAPDLDLPFLPQPPAYKQLQINEVKIQVEVADTQGKRSKGLGGREPLKEDEGMLFIFPKLDKYPFWMKGLSFPLDLIYIKEDKVVDIIPNVPPQAVGQEDAQLPIYQPKEPVDKVLEVLGGTAAKFNIKVGDSIKLSEI